MAKKHSVKSFLGLARNNRNGSSKTDKPATTTEPKKQEKSRLKTEHQQKLDGRDTFGAQTTVDERTTMTAAAATNESIQTIDSSAQDSSGYHSSSVVANGSNQFYPAARLASSGHERLAADSMGRPVMVNERISGEKSHMWPAMIDDGVGVCNKVHLIDDGDDDDAEVDVDVDIDGYDIDCIAAAAATSAANEDNNNISDRFHRHRYCGDSKSSLASRFDESFQLERQRHQQQQLQANTNNAAHHRLQQQQQYFHQTQAINSNYQQQQQQPLCFHNSSRFQPNLQQQQQQPQQLSDGLLNGIGSSAASISQQQEHQRFVNYIRQHPDTFSQQQPIRPPTNYTQQQYHTLVQYHPEPHHQYQQLASQRPYSYTTTTNNYTGAGGDHFSSRNKLANTATNSSSTYLSCTAVERPSASTRMQPANSRQYLTAVDHHHQQQQQSSSSQRRKSPSRAAAGQPASKSQQNHVGGSKKNKNKPSLDCCGKFAKFLLFTTNLLFWSAGIALGAWGILSLVEDHKYNLSQLLVFDSRMSLFQLLSWSFITLGCATILVGFCGCSAIFKNNRWILGLYIFLGLAIFALDLATGLLAIIFQEKLVANVRLRLANKLRADYGVQASFTAAIDYIQTRFECCGLDGHFDYDQSVWRLQRLGGFEATVARTCCHLRNTFDDQAHINPRPVNESMCQSTDIRFHQSYRYRKGCLDDLERLVRHKIWTFTMGCAAVGGVILISLMFATCFCRSIQSYSNSRKESLSSSQAAVLSPKHLENNSKQSAARHLTPTSSQRHHHHHQQHK